MTGGWGTELRDTRGTSKRARDARTNHRDPQAVPNAPREEVGGTQDWKVEHQRRGGKPHTEEVGLQAVTRIRQTHGRCTRQVAARNESEICGYMGCFGKGVRE